MNGSLRVCDLGSYLSNSRLSPCDSPVQWLVCMITLWVVILISLSHFKYQKKYISASFCLFLWSFFLMMFNLSCFDFKNYFQYNYFILSWQITFTKVSEGSILLLLYLPTLAMADYFLTCFVNFRSVSLLTVGFYLWEMYEGLYLYRCNLEERCAGVGSHWFRRDDC